MLLKIFVFSIVISFSALQLLDAQENNDVDVAESDSVEIEAPVVEASVQPTPTIVSPAITHPTKKTDLSPEQKAAIRAELLAKRAAWIKANPEQIKKMQENRLKRKQWMEEHPEEALKMKQEMRAKLAERKARMQAEAAR